MGIDYFSKCASICTDGAPSMIGCHNGLIAKVHELKPDVIAVHCFILQENLSANINMDHVNSVVVKIVNYIRSRGLSHRDFQESFRHLEGQFILRRFAGLAEHQHCNLSGLLLDIPEVETKRGSRTV
ncbi:unnamed protein product [Lepeophtheirus salmonis]|uniref:(salmon louse) hypothetical protein n=1 Tax=Lepeophtheirus salmonis TaxID=72036 RepID=A0A7R8HBB3_LEPSM|nr:unnamed protein product [Lepeophtheirus salmonis]CAF2991493.1 unnamed protein product [Lepeophtheirus salmonis]